MYILGWIVLGIIAGWIASLIVDNGGKGPVLDMVLGIVGALVGGAIFRELGVMPSDGSALYSLFVAVVGAVLVLVVYHALMGRRRRI